MQLSRRKHYDGDDDDELFLWYGWPTKGVKPYFQPGPLSKILTIANLRPEFRLCWMKSYSSDNHYTTAPQMVTTTPRRHNSFVYFIILKIEFPFRGRGCLSGVDSVLGARSLVVSDLCSDTNSSRFEFGCYLCAEVNSLQQSPG